MEENKINKEDNLQEENSKLKEKIKELENDNIFLKDENNCLKLIISNLEKEIKNLKINNQNVKMISNIEELSKSTNNFSKSKIIETKEEQEFLEKLFIEDEKYSKTIKLIYQATKDGDNIKSYWEQCEKKNNIIILFKTTKNKKFGGYISQTINQESGALSDPFSFLFSITKQKIFRQITHKDNIFISITPWLLDVGINGEPFLADYNGFEDENIPEYNVHNYELSGENQFTAAEIEVYQIEK